jgi:copper(I)-binding protein
MAKNCRTVPQRQFDPQSPATSRLIPDRDHVKHSAMHRRRLLFALLAFPASAWAHSLKFGKIAIGHAWALPVRHGDGQAFFPLVNNAGMPDELIAGRSSVCTLIELRRNNRYDDPPLASMPLEPGKPLPMRPTARHLRLVGLRQPLQPGGRFTIILDFLNAGEAEIEVFVEDKPGD